MRILFIGCVEGSYRLLQKLIEEGKDVVGVVTKESSDFNADYKDLAPLCHQGRKIPYIYVKNVNDDDSIEFMKSVKADIGFCFGWSQLVKSEVIRIFSKGMVGFHPAALPQNRGRHPVIWALALGLNETASTFFMITEGTDDGDIVSQEKIPITYEDTARTLSDKIMEVAVKQEIRIVDGFEKDELHLSSQRGMESNTWRKRGKMDGEIDWRMSSRSIYNLVRSLSRPYVGAHFVFKGNEYKVWKAKEIKTVGLENIEPGKVLNVSMGKIDIKTGEGGIRLVEYDEIDLREGDYVL